MSLPAHNYFIISMYTLIILEPAAVAQEVKKITGIYNANVCGADCLLHYGRSLRPQDHL